jgi:serine phosphatase RsbU (regulator of sigma subunit)
MSVKKLWENISFLGLDERDEFKYKEIVLMNKLVSISALLMLAMIPAEVLINGWELVYLEGIIIVACGSALIFNYLKWFTFAKFYFFAVATGIIFGFGLAIGKGSGNELFFIPCFIFPAMLFHNRTIILVLSGIAFAMFVLLVYLFDIVDPIIYVKPEIKNTIRYLFFIILFVIVFAEIYYFKSVNYRYQKLLATKNAEIEHKNREIIDSITYAKRIQEAILLPLPLVKNHLPDSFILFKPKDIVAGDFYWVDELDDLVIFAAADCTGHGVPGAMVSVVCHNALNTAIREFKLTDPGQILDKTRELVIKQFSKSTEDVKDGMDISLCVLHKKTLELTYSGANNPLWLLRKDDAEVFEIRPNKQPVGKGDMSRQFDSHTIQLSKGDLVYIFSDGFADQFGGDRGKKYKYKPFKDLLAANRNNGMDKQCDLINREFENWKKDLEQVDDICVIGVRV